MATDILVTGGSGFVGAAVIDELVSRGHRATALMHRKPVAEKQNVRTALGGLSDADAVREAMTGCDAVIHLVGIIQERPKQDITFRKVHIQGTANVLYAARQAGVRRYIHMSAIGAREDAPSEYHRSKYAAEQLVRESGLDWTIFRPSLIVGQGGEFMRMEERWARKRSPPWLFMPYFAGGFLGRGKVGLLQPVRVSDVARAFVDAIDNRAAIGQVYDLVGPERMSWPQFHRRCSKAIVGYERWTLPIPAWKARLLTRIVPAGWLPFNRDQVTMALEDNVGDGGAFERDFGWACNRW